MPKVYDKDTRIVCLDIKKETQVTTEGDDVYEVEGYSFIPVEIDRQIDYGHIKSQLIEAGYAQKDEFGLLMNSVDNLIKAITENDTIKGIKASLDTDDIKNFGEFCEFISDRTSQAEDDARGMAESLADDLGYGAYLSASSKSEDIAGIRMRNVEQLVSWLTEKLDGNPREHLEPQSFEASVHSLCTRDMLEHSSLGEDDEELDQVQLMTLHASKGLEFPYVYIVGMEEGVLPHESAIDNKDVTEERRLCYVGITRAMRELNLMEVRNRRGSQGNAKLQESRFISELPAEDLDIHNETRPKTEDEKMAEAKNVSMLLKEFLQSGG